jgi:hypothetical protein
MAKTFWNISKDSKIEIPEIQRDYAQGRINARVNTIRKGFVSDLLDAANFGTSLNLDFIFGQSVDRTNQANFNRNKQGLEQMLQVLKQYSKDTGVAFESKVAPKPTTASEDKLLIPFDGQQRLTTLFLLHLYIGVMAEKDISNLANFSYKTRESSTQFIEKIIENSKEILHFRPEEEKGIELLSDAIKNQSWFFSSWEKDPTVAGMLVMLDEIRKQTIEKEVDVQTAWHHLVDKQSVSFDYFDIQEEGFDEDLYVKMNARGKGLTDFENFRAWLEKKHKKTLPASNWVYKIDKDWLDLFWKTKKEVKDVDVNFLAFFKNMALLTKLRIHNTESDNNYTLEKEIIELLSLKRYTPTSEYEEENVFNESSLEYIFKILDILVSDKEGKLNSVIDEVWTEAFKGKAEKSFTQSLLISFDKLNLYHKAFFFSILRFLELKAETDISQYTEEDWDRFKDWLRISRNLIYNSRIDDSSAYVPAILAINNLDEVKVLDVNNALKQVFTEDEKTKWVSFFTKEQQKEECEKIAFLLSNVNALKWLELINKAENHSYFYGQIDFIFRLSDNNIIKFEAYLNKLLNLFHEDNVSSKEYVLQCLFFAFDENNSWLKSESANRFKFYKASKGNSRERDENWRNLFNDQVRRSVLKDLLNTNSCELNDIQTLITSKKEQLGYDNWKYFILDEPRMLDYCGNALFTKTADGNIRLLEKTLNSSRQRELRSFHFFTKMKTSEDIIFPPFEQFWYFTGERGNFNPCIVYGDWTYNGIDYYMDCFFDVDAFTIKLGRRTEGEICKEIENTLVEKHLFVSIEGNLYLGKIPRNELEEKLSLILDTLKEL